MTAPDDDPVLTGYAALAAWQALDNAQAAAVADADAKHRAAHQDDGGANT